MRTLEIWWEPENHLWRVDIVPIGANKRNGTITDAEQGRNQLLISSTTGSNEATPQGGGVDKRVPAEAFPSFQE